MSDFTGRVDCLKSIRTAVWFGQWVIEIFRKLKNNKMIMHHLMNLFIIFLSFFEKIEDIKEVTMM